MICFSLRNTQNFAVILFYFFFRRNVKNNKYGLCNIIVKLCYSIIVFISNGEQNAYFATKSIAAANYNFMGVDNYENNGRANTVLKCEFAAKMSFFFTAFEKYYYCLRMQCGPRSDLIYLLYFFIEYTTVSEIRMLKTK